MLQQQTELQALEMYLCNLPALMIASQQSHVRRISSLQEHEQGEGFQAVVTPVYKVAHEDVVCAGDLPPCLE